MIRQGEKMERIQGVLTEIIFRNDENGYTVAEMETDDELWTVVGILPSAESGTFFELKGERRIHPRFGEQFAFTESVEIMPSTAKGIEAFLASGVLKGVGPKLAAQLVSTFGEDTLRVIEEEPEKLLSVPGIGKKKAAAISETYAARREFARIALFFQEFGVSSAQALRLYRAYGEDSIRLIRENPYRLIDDVHGIGFRRADEIAAKLGIDPASPFRIRSGIRYYLQTAAGDGSTYMPKEMLCEQVCELLELTREQIADELAALAFDGVVQMDMVNGLEVAYLYVYYAAEQKVCRNIAAIRSGKLRALTTDVESSIQMTESLGGMTLSEKQKDAVRRSVASGISIITGGPGTGKTTIINTLLNVFRESDFRIAIAAPTGRAAKRIQETSGFPAVTIHRLLEYAYVEGTEDMQFNRTEDNPLEADVVIIDEASMVDLLLMKGLTDAISPGTRLIMVGDSDQLPSVGAGNVLCDMIESGFVETSRLTEIYRQAAESMIVVNAHRINHGEYPQFSGKDTDFFFMDRASEPEMQQLILDLVTRRLPAYYKDIDGLTDIQVLSPTRKGIVGTAELNAALQEAFNPPEPGKAERKFGDHVFRTGDKVMQIRNNYQLEWRIPGEAETGSGVFNGDVGFIAGIDTEDGILTVKFDEEKYVQYDFSMLEELELAYAVTVHKSQGSEFPIVVMPVTWFVPMLATRNLLYTAVTRGKRVVVLVGSRSRLNAMVDNDRTKLRYSGLAARLSNMMEFIR